MHNNDLIAFIRSLYGPAHTSGNTSNNNSSSNSSNHDFIPLHAPRFWGNEKAYLCDCIDTTYVSSVGPYVDKFEKMVADFTGASHAIATVNGTAALQISLKLAGVAPEEEVITQPLTFIATCNAISYCGAHPVFIDVDRDTLGMSPDSLRQFLTTQTSQSAAGCINTTTKRRIAAVVPMHTFGFPCRIAELAQICQEFNLPLIEDAAESLGSSYTSQGKTQHTGTFGKLAAFSFNGNKTITTGGGGMIITSDATLAKRARHLTTTAKLPHAYEFDHDEIGYNYRLPNINAALGCAQMENLERILSSKRSIGKAYAAFFADAGAQTATVPGANLTAAASITPQLMNELPQSRANFWLNAVILPDKATRDGMLTDLNAAGVMSRPIWRLMNQLPMYRHCQTDALKNADWLEQRVVNLPSSALPEGSTPS